MRSSLQRAAAIFGLLVASAPAIAQFGNPNIPAPVAFDDQDVVGFRAATPDPDIFLMTGFGVDLYQGEPHVIGAMWREDAAGAKLDTGAWGWVVGKYEGPVRIAQDGSGGYSWIETDSMDTYEWPSVGDPEVPVDGFDLFNSVKAGGGGAASATSGPDVDFIVYHVGPGGSPLVVAWTLAEVTFGWPEGVPNPSNIESIRMTVKSWQVGGYTATMRMWYVFSPTLIVWTRNIDKFGALTEEFIIRIDLMTGEEEVIYYMNYHEET